MLTQLCRTADTLDQIQAELATADLVVSGSTEYERTASTDAQAAQRLRAVESWLAMLRGTGDDPDVAGLLLEFARDDWRAHGGLAQTR